MGLIYFDLIKLAVPASARGKAGHTSAQYVVFGTYDLLYYALPSMDDDCGLAWLEQQHEDRHDLDWNYERHPLHAYCPDSLYERMKDVLDCNQNRSRPLVLTMARMLKHPLLTGKLRLDDVLSSLQDHIDASVHDKSKLDVSVCWNLGNADFVFISRPENLGLLRDLFLSLGGQDFCLTGKGQPQVRTRFVSFSSYCAFPIEGKEEHIYRKGLEKWLGVDKDLEFVNFVDALPDWRTIDGVGKKITKSRALLGDRDYQLIEINDASGDKRIAAIDYIVSEMLDSGNQSKILNSSLIPSLSIPGSGAESQSDTKNLLQPLSQSKNIESHFYELKSGAVDMTRKKLIAAIEDIARTVKNGENDGLDNSRPKLVELLDHCANTLDALYKHAVRLYASAYQNDVFHVVKNLYETLAVVLRSYWEYDDPSTDLREKIRNIYEKAMGFVSELQHVYTVLAISPHSYMETYYGSMRSLNASSNLWISYNGAIKALCELFPVCNENRTQDCSVLLVPYREKRSQSWQMFPPLPSSSILVFMQLNYQKMFDAKSTLFVIAHELGHYVFNVTRQKRSELMIKAIAANAIDRQFADAMNNPLRFLINVLNKDEDGYELHLNIRGELDNQKHDELFQKIDKGLGQKYARVISAEVENFSSEYMKEPGSKHEQHYGRDVISTITEFINGHLPTFCQKVSAEIAKVSADFLRCTETYENDYGIRFDPYQIVRFKTYWEDEQLCLAPLRALNKDGKNERGRIDDRLVPFTKDQGETFLGIFQEIHADIFACMSIDYKLKDYLDHISYFSDTMPNLLGQENDIARIMVVCDTALDDKDCKALIDWVSNESSCPFGEQVRERARDTIRSIKTSTYYEYLLEYGKEVVISVKKRVKTIENEKDQHKHTLLKDIREFARGGANASQYLWRFWLYAMA